MPNAPLIDDVGVGRLLARGFARRCPRCGQGGLFRRWFSMTHTCPGCMLEFDREPGWVLGAMTINTIVTFLAMLAVMITGFALTYEDFATLEVTLLTAAVAVVVPAFAYPFSKTIWIAIDLAMVPDREERRQVGYQRDR